MLTKNETVTLKITDLTNEASGVGRVDGMVVFVPFTAVGDVIKAKILKVTKNCAYGKIEEILTASPDRVTPDCEVFGKCGGCLLRHISYEAEAAAKEKAVKDAFMRIGKLSPEFLPIIANRSPERYRNKAQFPVGKAPDGKTVCGFYAPNSHRIIDCRDCKLQPEIFSEIVAFILAAATESKIAIYNEAEHNGVLRHICVRRGYHSGEINVTLVARRKVPEFNALARAVCKKFSDVKGVVLNINTEQTNVIFGETEYVLCGCAEITDKMCGNTINISPRSFYQVNTDMAETLYAKAKEFAVPDGKTIIDLYCGAGTIGLSMAKEAKKIIGVEIAKSAVENAVKNAELNGCENAEFICGDAGEATTKILADGVKPDVIIVDPARRGCDALTLDNIAALSPERVVMISCNPATAARDCAFLSEKGYKTLKVQSIDLFSRTEHVETVVLLSKL